MDRQVHRCDEYLPIKNTEQMMVNPEKVPQMIMASLEKMMSSLILAISIMHVTEKA